jgi:hypothetical protein
MTAQALATGRPRTRLRDQLDRMDTILDALAEALPEAVADATREGARQAVRAAIHDLLADHDFRAAVAGHLSAACAAPATPVPGARFQTRACPYVAAAAAGVCEAVAAAAARLGDWARRSAGVL